MAVSAQYSRDWMIYSTVARRVCWREPSLSETRSTPAEAQPAGNSLEAGLFRDSDSANLQSELLKGRESIMNTATRLEVGVE